ncbi:MAG: hypothetical protein EAZ65_05945 [Verrucomicrobia bacterium]|nr:MAG: hypothetical protein EAZ84_01490 [Verrucomicrobiota bacterium]TAE87781.1 MAG: hypothetical protein EAZ82_06080 [Verrucomicrobiota bacterium]TAF25524.1 MAG: hypothetical protein EAZ71_07005 [Verrucomicrobiota bacterium]TAF41409.1 MAG: hypothetical protein EAZ65_05945 [Verrucomicrobiota bacterium]
MKPNWIRKAHRWLGLVFSITLLMSSGSGVLHIVMTRGQAPPPPARPSGGGLDAAAIRVSAAEAVAALGKTVHAINLRTIGGRPCYQIFLKEGGGPRYVDAMEGRVDDSLEDLYAAEIAAGFLGEARVVKTGYLTAFDDEYIGIFRILPVHRFAVADGKGTRVYVSTVTGSVTRHTDDAKQFEADAFTRFHKLGFIRDKNLRDLVLGVLTAGVFVVSVLGLLLFFLNRPKVRRPF